ncbi:DNA uptake protein ComE-like DNA-binding protein [Flavobacterium endophyticum]|uniref:DNA uptake protein ComE-like DNA-binding protein n=1 Tax=Flavobacterium endophyticum TaxID=1540163 RepID=A0A495MJY8_9FLAO|nr:helix-hairpin-helix domain-containing protein [Flavobacterium endophyticum]RKS25685.1 DNA uptake protein ComE-like DNA-binding protein [Flavobacterium endophyticum]
MPTNSFFKFDSQQRTGIFILILIIAGIQLAYYCIDVEIEEDNSVEKQEWLSLQPEIDKMKKAKIDFKPKIYPFNPNFITDFKGYKLGMSTVEIDRLLKFREGNKYVNSAEEFQAVTKVSDSLLNAIAPYFKFPDWVKNKKSSFASYEKQSFVKNEKIILIDINKAAQEDLIKIYGIGHGLSERILKQKEILGGFVSMEQMNDIWGLSPEVIEKLNAQFKIGVIPNVKKIKINDASVKELSQFPYFRYPISKEIVIYRSMNGGISGSEDLIKIKGFPVEKVKIIEKYLEY